MASEPLKTYRLRRNLLAAVIGVALVALTWAVFGRTTAHEFVDYDDPSYVTAEPKVSAGLTVESIRWAFIGNHSGNWHPVTTLSHMLDAQLYGMNPAGHHRTNVVLHSAAVLFLFLVLRQMTVSQWRSAFVAAVFAIHPLRVESVAWVAERKDVLSGVFFALTLGAYARFVRKRDVASYVVLAVVFALGLMSKGTLVTVPFLLLLLDDWPLRRRVGLIRLLPEKVPLLLMSGATCVVTLMVQSHTISTLEKLPLTWRLSNACLSVATYIWQMFSPAKLAPFYPHLRDQIPLWLVVVCGAGILGVTVAVTALRRVPPYVPVGWLWYLGMLFPVLGLVQVGLQAHADRYTYLPQIGLYVLVTWGVADAVRSRPFGLPWLSAAAVAVLAALAWQATHQTGYWRNSEALWRRAVVVTSRNAVAQTNLGNLLPGADAIPHYEAALAADPESALPMNNLAWVLATHPDYTVRNGTRASELALKAAWETDASDPVILRTLAAAYSEAGQFQEAARIGREALAIAEQQENSALASDLRNQLADIERRVPLRDHSLLQPPQ
ncbi:MAG: glycosyltransferase family 39 protein [Chthoniobacterales bacterium]|nr:glycosyltransferase family 39 protein [Chthoniobacterales bacterium]